jgi:uncharacterized protein with HEPN domain
VKKKDRTYNMYLDDLLIAMTRISEYITEHTFEIIGVASKNIPVEIK